MTEGEEITRKVINVLEDGAFVYMLVGSFSTNMYGIPRSTKDADFVLDVADRLVMPRLYKALDHLLEFEPQTSFEGLTGSIRHEASAKDYPFRIEFFERSDDPFAVARFQNRVRHDSTVFGRAIWIPKAEDVVIQKLRWGRDKDRIDARDVIAVQGNALDYPYVEGGGLWNEEGWENTMRDDNDEVSVVGELERLLRCSLPSEYRSWLLDPDSKYPLPSLVTIPDSSAWTDEVTSLYAVEQLLIEARQEAEMHQAGVRTYPIKTLPIGDNEMGDSYLISLREEDFGSVYFMFHETANPQEDEWAGIYVLSKSFASWIESLRIRETDESIPDWDAIRKKGYEKLVNTPTKPWWRFW